MYVLFMDYEKAHDSKIGKRYGTFSQKKTYQYIY
jgi:hypothetical protein